LEWEKKLLSDKFDTEKKALQEKFDASKKTSDEALKATEARARAQDLVIGELNKEKLDLGRVIGDLHLQIRMLNETLKHRE
jgi:hypothetical protein